MSDWIWKIYWSSIKHVAKNKWSCFIKWLLPHMPQEDIVYGALAPTADAQRIEVYSEALSQALLNENISNIAVTGAYGSGKSSFLRTYFKNTPSFWPFGCKKNKVITISLADLAKKETVSEDSSEEKNISQQEVEIGILHQLFYQEKAGSLTDSHFIKIQKFGFWRLIVDTMCVMLCVLSTIHIIWPKWLTTTFSLPAIGTTWVSIWHWASIAIMGLGIIWIVYHLIRVISQYALTKFSLNIASIEIQHSKKSVLNEHIDEIIYFFEVTKYNVVIIEDLDRFKLPNIFVKLREINNLINNSSEVKQHVRFIYALTDGMFLDKTRAKFFDFIIPIIPMVDISNAGDFLRTKLPHHLGNVIDDIAIYLNDARLIQNIVNEYNIYKYQQLKNTTEGDVQLFVLIVYKNLFPNDFENLRTNHDGLLAIAINQKQNIINNLSKQIREKITELRERITNSNAEQLRNVEELRKLLIGHLVQDAMSKSSGYRHYNKLNCGGHLFTFTDAVKDDYFKFLTQTEQILYRDTQYNEEISSSKKFAQWEKEVYGNEKYLVREVRLLDKVKVNEINQEIQKLLDEESQLRKKTMKELLEIGDVKIDWGKLQEDEKTKVQRTYISDMLHAGHLSENYADYISLFHEGSMTQSDYQFIRDVKFKETPGFDYKLTNVDTIVKKLDVRFFTYDAILNFQLLDYLITQAPQGDKCKTFFSTIEKSKNGMTFIGDYIYNGIQVGPVIQRLCSLSPVFWSQVLKSKETEDVKLSILQLILQHCREEDIQANLQDYKEYLSSRSDYFTWLVDNEKLHYWAKKFDLKFTQLDETTSDDDIQYVYENNLYCITISMLQRVIPKANLAEDMFNQQNYTYLHTEKLSSMLAYVRDNVEEYITSVCLELPDNKQEHPQYEYELLSREDLSNDIKEQIIKKGIVEWQTVDEFGLLSDVIQCMLYQHRRTQITWKNAFKFYMIDSMNFEEYIKDDHIAKVLSEYGKPEINNDSKDTWEAIQKMLLTNSKFNRATQYLVKLFDLDCDVTILKKCDKYILPKIIDHNLVKVGVEEYNYLHDIDIVQCKMYFVNHWSKLLPNMASLNFTESDLIYVLEDRSLSTNDKINVLNNISPDILQTSDMVTIVAEFLLRDDVSSNNLDDGVIAFIKVIQTMTNVNTILRIRLFNKFIKYQEKEKLKDILTTFSKEYVDDSGHLRAHLPVNDDVRLFCYNLSNFGYIKNIKNFKKTKGYIAVSFI